MENTLHKLNELRDSTMPRQRRIWKQLKGQLLTVLKEEQSYWEEHAPRIALHHAMVIARLEKQLTEYQIYPMALSATPPQTQTVQPSSQSTTHLSAPVPPSLEGQQHPNPSLPF